MSSCSSTKEPVLTAPVRETVEKSPFLALTTLSGDGRPHTIAVAKVKEIRGSDTLVFGVYKMVRTRQNLAETGGLQVVAVNGQAGYRLSGKATATAEEVTLTVDGVEALL
jgi:predicted pyridoxine 5'-phosphate oxidase superfamily flavin-nucleotide-binding protein